MAKDKQPWITDRRGFTVTTCAMLRKYLAHETGYAEKDVQVHKTDAYVIVNYAVQGGGTKVHKIKHHSVLYVMEAKQFEPVIEEMKAALSAPKLYTLDQIKAAFWTEFHKSGELWFNYLGTDEENEACTQAGWDDFEQALSKVTK